jgi:arylsulfatase A-like enzyme
MRAVTLIALSLVPLLGCGHTGPSEPTPSNASSASTPSPSPSTAPHKPSQSTFNASTSAAAKAALPYGRPYYELAAHPERAELWTAGVRTLDFGETSGAQYTLGGWLTGTGDDHGFGQDRALLGVGKVVKVALPVEHSGASRLSLRVRSFADTTLSVHVNGEPIADVPLDGKTFKVIDKELPAERTHPGENLLQLRVSRAGASPRGGEATIALDWIRIGPAASAHADSRPPALQELAPPAAAGQKPALHLAGGDQLAYSFQVPKDGELRATFAPKGGAKLALNLERDGQPLETLYEGSEPGTLRIPLDKHAGEIVRMSVRAQGPAGSSVELQEPAIVVVEPKPAAAAQTKQVKNIIIVLVDTLRADKLDAYKAGSRVKTPGLSTFLESAAVMLNARTPENWTKPSVASLLSSLLPWQHNAFTGEAVVPSSVELLPELLRDRGYYTGAFIANGYVSDKFGFKQGWNTYRNYIREGRRTIAQEVAADVVEWLDERPKDKPFLLYMHTIDPHVPYKPPKSFLDLYDPAPYAGPVDFSKTNELLEKIKIGSLKLNERDKVRLEALYDGEISYHDVHFAATLRALQERGLAEETAIVVTADHGEEFWDHGSVGHGHSVYDELLRVPMIVRIPGLTEGKQRLPDAVSLVDVMPTLLDAVGQEKPDHLVGESFYRELQGQGASVPRANVSGFMQSWRTLGIGSLKLIQRAPENMWLYDVQQDPGEKRDVAKERPIALRYARGLLGVTITESQNGKTYGSADAAAKPKGDVKKQREHKEEKTNIDPETEAQLRALGYVGTSAK